MDIQAYQEFYGDQLWHYDANLNAFQSLREEDINILTNIGVPQTIWHAGKVLTTPIIFEEKYLALYSERHYYICLMPDGGLCFYSESFDEPLFCGTSLQSFIEANYVYKRFMKEIGTPLLLGQYNFHSAYKYVDHLRDLLEPIEPNLSQISRWSIILEELGYGMY